MAEVESNWEIIDGDFPEAGHIEGDGFTVRIMYDDHHESPRETSYCCLGHMLCAHPNYNLGDEQAPQPFDTSIECPRCEGDTEDPDRFEIRDYRGYGYTTIASGSWDAMVALLDADDDPDDSIDPAKCSCCKGEGEIVLGIYDYIVKKYGATVVLPLFLLDHSGLSMRAGSAMGSTASTNRFVGDEAGWDTSMVGFIFDTEDSRAEMSEEWQTPEKIEECLRREVEEYDSYLRGDVYYIVSDIPGLPSAEDSCGGYIGSEWAEQEAREFANHAHEAVQKERAQRAEAEETIRRLLRLDDPPEEFDDA